jgi:Bacterial Ig-like domain (group 3)/Beta-propeller repeat/IPT/TIG domain
MTARQTFWPSRINYSFLFMGTLLIRGLFSVPVQADFDSVPENNLPLCFEKNEGQVDEHVKYVVRDTYVNTYLTEKTIVMAFQGNKESSVLKMHFLGGSKAPGLEAEDELIKQSHYFFGSDPKRWHTRIPNYAKVTYQNVYPGIDVLFYGQPHHLKYEILVSPYTHPQQIRLHFDQVKNISIDENEVLNLALDEQHHLSMQKLQIYQKEAGEKKFIKGHFVLLDTHEIGLAIEPYDESLPLVIESSLDYPKGTIHKQVELESHGNFYLIGSTASLDIFTTPDTYHPNLTYHFNGVITKLDSSRTQPLFSTYIGLGGQQVKGMTVDAEENIYLTGNTLAKEGFPVTAGAYQADFKGYSDAFIAKLSPSGSSLLYSTLLSGENNKTVGKSVAVDSHGNAYVTGSTNSKAFPISPHAFQKGFKLDLSNPLKQKNTFVVKLNSTGSDLIYSTYLGGWTETPQKIAVDPNENALITGHTSSSNFPITLRALQTVFDKTHEKDHTGFLVKLNATGSELVYSTYLEKEDQLIHRLATDSSAHLSPSYGPTSGGTAVVISGKDLTHIKEVKFGEVPAVYFTIDHEHQITAISPPGNGTVPLLMKTADETVAVNPVHLFTYEPVSAAIFLSVSPNPASVGQRVNLTTQISSAIATGSVDFYEGNKLLGTAPVVKGKASLDIEALTIDLHILQVVYRGDINLNPVASAPFNFSVIALQGPTNLKAQQVRNPQANRSDYINVLTWNAPLHGSKPTAYRIYKDQNLKQLMGTVESSSALKFEEYQQKKNKNNTYFIVSVDQMGRVSKQVSITVAKD